MIEYSIFYVGTETEVGHHAEPLKSEIRVRVEPLESVLETARTGDLCILFNEYFTDLREGCVQLREKGCLTLYAIDGILEWRNSWEFPEGDACRWTMRPILSDKAACVGQSQARILESWGNMGRCEVTGIPRLDRLLNRSPRDRQDGDEILVMTAKNPGFTEEQRALTLRSLRDLKSWFEQTPLPVRPVWRITGEMEETLGVRNQLGDLSGRELAEVLEGVDAVVTTPSTAMLEAMLQGVPVALLDYHNCPHYVPAAWNIAAEAHIQPVLTELLNPGPARMLYQGSILRDSLECRGEATPRMVRLIQEMIRIGHDCRTEGREVILPNHILPLGDSGPEERFNLEELYPDHPVFGNMDRASLQAQLAHLRIQMKRLESGLPRRVLKKLRENALTGPLLRGVRGFVNRAARPNPEQENSNAAD